MVLAGCTGELPTQLEDCPDESLTWADAEPVFAANCTRCHSSQLPSGERNGAPLFTNFDTPEAARMNAFSTWPQITTGRMPLDRPISDEDARVLWAWLSCEGPE